MLFCILLFLATETWSSLFFLSDIVPMPSFNYIIIYRCNKIHLINFIK